ncbi:MAG TPA: TonB-dependent receptor [Candidatus Angelobacter sp.]|nr:TonB-dependent receptor [Candidatus Angelobacter sp.]
MRLFRIICNYLAALSLATCVVSAQGVGASGSIRGTVTDPSGAVVVSSTVTATDASKGFKYTAASDNAGQYQFTALPAATYNLSASGTGFQKELTKGVVVNIGEVVVIDFHLQVSSAAAVLEVTSEPPAVETTRGSQAETINEQYIQELPIDRRDYLTYTLLAPAVTDSTRIAGDVDFRVKQTPQSGLSFYGSNGRGNSVTVDGGEANDDSGGVRLNLSQDAVQEFQINRSNYNAELGGAAGATINIVSRSGGNDTHGSLYGFFRNDALDAANPFAFSQALAPGQAFNPAAPDVFGTHIKDSLSRQQWGLTLGTPIRKDKTFFFAAFENNREDAQKAVPLLTGTNIFRPDTGQFSGNNQLGILNGLTAEGGTPVPCLSNPATVLPASVCAGILSNILTVNPKTSPLSAFLVNQLETNGGVFPFDTRRYQFSARVDHQFSEKDQAFIRYSFGHDNEQSPDLQSLIGFSDGSSVQALDNTAQASWFHSFSPRTQNEARFQYNYTGFNVIPNQPGEVGLNIPGFANLGTNIFIPSKTILRRYEFADNFTMVRGHHTMKMGFYELYRGDHTESHTFFPGRFVFGNLPGGILSPCLQVPAACGLNGQNPATINSLQSAALGLPQFYQQGFGNPTYNYPRPFTAGYWQDGWAVRPNLTLNFGLRYEVDSQYGNLNTPYNNFAPRASFAWDPFGDHKTVVRGGYGIYYAPTYGQIGDVVHTLGLVNGFQQIAQTFVPLTGAPGNPALTSATIFQTLFAQGKVQCTTPAAGQAACITPADLLQFGIVPSHTAPLPPLSVVFSGQPGFRSAYSQQAELGIEREMSRGLSVSLSGIYSHTIGLPVAIDINDLATTPLTTAKLTTGQTVSFHNFAAPQCNVGAGNPCFANPGILQAIQYSSKGSALYEGGIVEVKKRFGSHVSLLGNYTYSKAYDTTFDFNSDFGPQDNLNLAGERSLSEFDQRHKVVAAAILETPNGWSRALSGFILTPIFRYNSGHPFNLLAGTDVNGDRHSTNDRPIGAARNTGEGPDFIDFDMRLAKKFKLSEKTSLQLMAEGFNLANRLNFASVNNTVGANFGQLPGFTTFNVHGSNIGPTAPLGFTSALSPRTLQLGLRLAF